MPSESLASLKPRLGHYKGTAALEAFVERCSTQPWLKALVLFGSVARGDWHEYSDADICVIVNEPEVRPLDREWWLRIISLSDGFVQPHIYGQEQFLAMVDEIHRFAIEIVHWGILLAGDHHYWDEVKRRFAIASEHYGLEKTPKGWRWRTDRERQV